MAQLCHEPNASKTRYRCYELTVTLAVTTLNDLQQGLNSANDALAERAAVLGDPSSAYATILFEQGTWRGIERGNGRVREFLTKRATKDVCADPTSGVSIST